MSEANILEEFRQLNDKGHWFYLTQTPEYTWICRCVIANLESRGNDLLECIENFINRNYLPIESDA